LRKTLKQRIQEDITKSTYYYFNFEEIDPVFRSFVYGDSCYSTLNSSVYWFLTTEQLDWDDDFQVVSAIDTVELVSRLYATFIRADSSFHRKYPHGSERHRKNFIYKFLRQSAAQILKEQFDHYNRICQELKVLNNDPEQFHYFSLDCDHGRFLEYLSWKEWQNDREQEQDWDSQRIRLLGLMNVLNDKERTAVSMVLSGRPYKEIARKLKVSVGRVRKILYSAKKKLKTEQGRQRSDLFGEK